MNAVNRSMPPTAVASSSTTVPHDVADARRGSASCHSPEIAIILPAYNEELTIAQTIRDFRAACPRATIYVINNNSKDRTAEVARAALAEIPYGRGAVLNEYRQGKAFAVRRAFTHVDADVYVMVDADCTYSAADLPRLLAPVLRDEADLVVGDRHGSGDYRREISRRFHNTGNQLVRKLINGLFDTDLHDIFSGYRVFSRRFVKSFPILSAGFELETEITLHALDCRLCLVEIPVSYRDRPANSTSKLNTLRDGTRVLRTIFSIFRHNRPLLFFGGIAVLFFTAGTAVGLIPVVEFYETGRILHLPSAILATGLMLCSLISFALAMILDTIARINRQRFELRLMTMAAGRIAPVDSPSV